MPSFSIYVDHIIKEIEYRHHSLKEHTISSLYFGGGTPSLLPTPLIEKIISHLQLYFSFEQNCELSLEINPGTLSSQKIRDLVSLGINRFSLGVQTFNDSLLKFYRREHSSLQSIKDLELFFSLGISFSADILFALKDQTLSLVEQDLSTLLSFQPKHISCYLLTLPKNHRLKKTQAPENTQIKMFELVSSKLKAQGYDHYEISNFAKSSYFSKHNLAYWTDQSYWGLGLSAHSYLKISDKNKIKRIRFWNPKTIKSYFKQVSQIPPRTSSFNFPYSFLPQNQKEFLAPHEALTDFCYTRLRTRWGISKAELTQNFSQLWTQLVIHKLHELEAKTSWIKKIQKDRWVLDPTSYVFCNLVFQELTFLKEDLLS